ncbi:MAG: (2Fe-2S) ferredoxin domain-containing protein [Thermodesulfobacteriota bacterium]
MSKLTAEDLVRLRDKARAAMDFEKQGYRGKVVMHTGTCGIAAGAEKVMAVLTAELKERNVTDLVVTTSGCAGICSREPLMTVQLKGQSPVKYTELTEAKVKSIVEEHLVGGQPVEKLAFVMGCEAAY